MSQWMTAQEISERYIVGEERLLMYSQRGNLAFRRAPDGQLLFEESTVALFFRPRGAHGVGYPTMGANLGVLGVARLGEAPLPAVSSRDARRRSARIAHANRTESPKRIKAAG